MSKSERDSQSRQDSPVELEVVTLGQRFYPYAEPMRTRPITRKNLPDGVMRHKQVGLLETGGIAEITWIPGMYVYNMPTRKFTFRLPHPDFNSAQRYTGRKYSEYLPRGIVDGYVSPEVRLTIPVSNASDGDVYAFVIENEEKQLVTRFAPTLDRDEERGIVFTGGNTYWQDMEDSPVLIQMRFRRWTGQYGVYRVEDGDQLIIPDDPSVLSKLTMQIYKV